MGADGLPDAELDGFCSYLLAPCRRSAKTWATYANQAAVYIRFLGSQGKSWKEATRDDLRLYYKVRSTTEFQTGQVLKGQSWNVAAAAIVHLYEYGQETGLVRELPFDYRRSRSLFGRGGNLTADLVAKVTPEPINFISIQAYKQLWRTRLRRQRNFQRNLALSDLLVTTGLRISEALSLRTNQIPDPDHPAYARRVSVTIRVVGKGSKPRNVRIPKRILRAIRFYMEDEREDALMALERKAHAQETSEVFLSNRGTPLSARSVEKLFQSISSAIGVALTPHGCRHTFAVYQLEAMIKRMAKNLKELRATGADAYRQILHDPLRQLQLLLGHAQISTTYQYLDFLEESEDLVESSLADWTDWNDENAS